MSSFTRNQLLFVLAFSQSAIALAQTSPAPTLTPDWFISTSFLGTTVDYAGGTSNIADATNVDLGHKTGTAYASGDKFNVTDNDGLAYYLGFGRMFNRHIGLQLSYQVDPVTHYTIDYTAVGKADATRQKTENTQVGLQGVLQFFYKDRYGIIGDVGMCYSKQIHNTNLSTEVDAHAFVPCGALSISWNINERLSIGIKTSRVKGESETLTSESLVKSSGTGITARINL